ncbi:MAG: hypothetical protein IBX43_07950 [Campylobacterales bacterium]|nr:hypothetical protein [Campylobacterales bacterium]
MKFFGLERVLLALITGLLLAGCGYLPTSKQAREVLGEKIFVEVTVSLENPESAVLIKDATRKAVITRFHASLVPQEMAKTTLWVDLANVRFVPLQYDPNGYVIVYRAVVLLNVTRRGNGEKKSYNTQGFYDFAIEPNAVITDTQRFEAIRQASLKALNSFVAKVGAEGSRTVE